MRRSNLAIFCISVAVSISSALASFNPSLCTRTPLTPLVIGGCPEKCSPFSVSEFQKCSALASRRCTFQACEPPASGSSQCTVAPSYLSNVTICAGNTLTLDGVNLKSALDSVSYSVGIRVPPQKPRYKKTDIFIVADANSGTNAAARSRKIAFGIVEKLAHVSDGSVQIGFGVLRNKRRDADGFSVRTRITSDFAKVKKWIRKFKAQYTGEPNLRATVAFSRADHMGWRSDAKRILVYAAARPFTEPTKIIATDGSVFCYVRDRAATFLKNSLITVYPINLGDINGFPSNVGCDDSANAKEGQATFIAKQTAGMVLDGDMPAEAVDTIVSNVETIPTFSYIGFDINDCKSVLKSVKNIPAFPQEVPAGGQITAYSGLSIKPSVCGQKWAKCSIRYTLYGKPYTSVGLLFKNIKC